MALAATLVAFARPAPAAAATPAARADVHAVIAQVLEAYGGRDVLEGVHSYRVEGTFFNAQRHDESTTVRIFARPDRLKVLIGYDEAFEVRIMDGRRGWRNEAGGLLEPASGPMRDAMVLQTARANVPWILAERESIARLIEAPADGSLQLEGKSTIGIEIPLENGLVFRAWINTGTHRVEASQGVIDHANFQTHFETYYSDFREVNGVRFAYHEENWASGVQTGLTTLGKIAFNPRLRPDEFQPPPSLLPVRTGKKPGDS
jgi:hypothetical protein